MYKFSVKTTHIANEIVSEILNQFGAQGVCINDPSDFDEIDKNGIVWDYVDQSDKKGEVVVEAYFDCEDAQAVLKGLQDKFAALPAFFDCDIGSLNTTYEKIEEVDWVDEWRKYYNPIDFGKVLILPSWMQEPPNRTVVKIDLGSAFGSGQHESTAMCLDMLCEMDLRGKEIADVGCGSGILGISALKLGAKSVYFCDLDSQAVENARTNVEINEIDKDKYIVEQASLLSSYQGKADIICANITADILLLLKDQAASKLKRNGSLLISGIISEKSQDVLQGYLSEGFVLKNSLSRGDWRSYAFELK